MIELKKFYKLISYTSYILDKSKYLLECIQLYIFQRTRWVLYKNESMVRHKFKLLCRYIYISQINCTPYRGSTQNIGIISADGNQTIV